jgi:hypothetical protein
MQNVSVAWFYDSRTCFMPRHGLSFDRNGNHYDLVICFECKVIEVHRKGSKSATAWWFKGSRDNLDAALEAAGISISRSQHH